MALSKYRTLCQSVIAGSKQERRNNLPIGRPVVKLVAWNALALRMADLRITSI
jgi:hypothetical protein